MNYSFEISRKISRIKLKQTNPGKFHGDENQRIINSCEEIEANTVIGDFNARIGQVPVTNMLARYK